MLQILSQTFSNYNKRWALPQTFFNYNNSWALFFSVVYGKLLFTSLKKGFYRLFPGVLPKIIAPKTEIEFFCENSKTYFDTAISSQKELSKNIEDIFYDKEKYNATMKEQNNFLENKWKTSVYMKYTPRGNVIMCYDSFKLGFVYYCDTSLPYEILNSLAAEYVIKYHCLDFFIDNEYYENNKSKLIDLYFKEEKKKNANKDTDKLPKTSLLQEHRSVFVKKKMDKSKIKQDKATTDKETANHIAKEMFTNKFIKMGKVHNFSFLKKEIPTNENNHFKSSWTNTLNEEDNLQKKVFNYRDFKKMQK